MYVHIIFIQKQIYQRNDDDCTKKMNVERYFTELQIYVHAAINIQTITVIIYT